MLKINQRVKSLTESTTLAITAKAKELKSKGHDIVNFAAGEPDFDTPSFIKDAAIESIQKGFTKYTPTVGTPELREAIAKRFLEDNQLTYKPSQIIVSCGAKHSIYNLVQVLVDDGDEVIIPSPYWVSYPEMVKMAGGKCVIVKTDLKSHFKITPEQLKKSLTKSTKLFILCSPSNPTGMVYSRKELEDLAEICIKNDIFVISDEIYEKLIYDIDSYVSFASLSKEAYALTATVNGVSKSYSMTGWRIGYCGAPQEVIDYAKKFQDHTTSNPASMSQMAALAALKAPADAVKAMRDEFKKRRDIMMASLKDIPQIKFVVPQGAFYIFCDITKLGIDDVTFANRVLTEVNVAVIPGEGFGAPGNIRLSFATSVERIQEGIKRIAQWVQQQSQAKSKVGA